MADDLGLSPPLTHWEFFTACTENGFDATEIDALRRLTRAYELAVFAPGQPTPGDAEDALDAARDLAGRTSSGATGS